MLRNCAICTSTARQSRIQSRSIAVQDSVDKLTLAIFISMKASCSRPELGQEHSDSNTSGHFCLI
jgi:hypothetical protein